MIKFQCDISVILFLNGVFSYRVGSDIFVFGTIDFAAFKCALLCALLAVWCSDVFHFVMN